MLEEKKDITLKPSVNTMVGVNGQNCYVYETNVNNTHPLGFIINCVKMFFMQIIQKSSLFFVISPRVNALTKNSNMLR